MAKLIEITGKALSGEWGLEDESRTGIPVLRTTNFTNLGIINYGDVVTRNITKKNISEKFLRKGDIIIEKSGGSDKQPVGRVVLFNGEENRFLFNNFTGVLRVKDREKWVPDYVFHALFANYRNGGTRKYENKTTGLHNLKTDLYINNYEIEWVNIAEQKNVCATLRKIESIISDMNKEIAYLDELIKARFVEMFGDGFETTELRNICRVTSGGTPSTKNSDYYNGTIPWVTTTALGPNHIDGTKAKAYISEEAVANSATKIIPSGSILFGIRVGVGKTSINDVDICTNQDIVAILDIDEKKFSKLFIKHVLDANRAHYDSLKKGATILGITSDDLKNTPIPLVSIKAQKDFEVFVTQVDKSKFAVQKSLEKTKLLFDSLMQEYFG